MSARCLHTLRQCAAATCRRAWAGAPCATCFLGAHAHCGQAETAQVQPAGALPAAAAARTVCTPHSPPAKARTVRRSLATRFHTDLAPRRQGRRVASALIADAEPRESHPVPWTASTICSLGCNCDCKGILVPNRSAPILFFPFDPVARSRAGRLLIQKSCCATHDFPRDCPRLTGSARANGANVFKLS